MGSVAQSHDYIGSKKLPNIRLEAGWMTDHCQHAMNFAMQSRSMKLAVLQTQYKALWLGWTMYMKEAQQPVAMRAIFNISPRGMQEQITQELVPAWPGIHSLSF